MTTITDEQHALSLDPFEGDWDGEGPMPLSNKIVTIRKARKCSNCHSLVQVGDRSRVMASLYDGIIKRHTFCVRCLNLMIEADNGSESANGELTMLYAKGFENETN